MSNSPSHSSKSNPSAPNPAAEAPLAIALQWVPGFVNRLLRDLPRISDLRMRSLALGERLQPLTPDDIVAVARRIHDRIGDGDELAREVLHCFQDTVALEMRLGAERMRKLAVAAQVSGHEAVALLLMPAETGSAAAHHRTHKDLRDMPLGQRKALARSQNRDVLLKLLEDEHPHVQEMLLSNPRVTVREVMAVAARRGVKHHVLRGIARHPRWMHNFEVHRALVKNPDTPLDIAGRLLATLGKRDLEEVASDDGLDAALRRIATKRLAAYVRVEVAVFEIDNDDA